MVVERFIILDGSWAARPVIISRYRGGNPQGDRAGSKYPSTSLDRTKVRLPPIRFFTICGGSPGYCANHYNGAIFVANNIKNRLRISSQDFTNC
jgi:hypothetical protein